MKHGDKAKAKSAKAKASGKEASSKKTVAKSSKGAEKTAGKAVQAGSKKDSPPKAAAVQKGAAGSKADNGKGKGIRPVPTGPVSFSNPIIGEAFKRAIKKYPTAFRRLTD